MPSVTTKSAMTPSRIGRTTWIVSGARPTISSACRPTARMRVPSRFTATKEGLLATIPAPFPEMSAVELPRSIPIFLPSQLLVGMSWIAPLGVDRDPLDLRADRGQLARHVLVAALDMPGVVEQALAFGAEGSDHQRRA